MSLNKKADLQDFFYARNSSSMDIERKFGISPSQEGKRFILKNGVFKYSNDDIKFMLDSFQEAMSCFSGKKTFMKRFRPNC